MRCNFAAIAWTASYKVVTMTLIYTSRTHVILTSAYHRIFGGHAIQFYHSVDAEDLMQNRNEGVSSPTKHSRPAIL